MRLLSQFLLGVTAGIRSMSGPAAAVIASQRSRGQSAQGSSSKVNLPVVLRGLAAAEFVADKLPFVPDRRKPPAFAWRMITGALSAAAVSGEDDSLVVAALVGAAGAAAGTFGGAALRSWLASSFGHDFPAALTEDALVLGLAALAASRLKDSPPRLRAAA